MSDANTSVSPAVPTVTLDPAAKPAPAPVAAAPAPAPSTEPNEKPSWLDSRLERERRSMLKDLGYESIDDAKQASAELHAKRESEKSAAQKAAENAEALKATKAQNEELSRALGGYAKAKLAGLTDAQRAAVEAVAGTDAAKQLATIDALAPTWAASAAPAVKAAPVDTAPPPTSPREGGTATPSNPKSVYAELQKTNPVLAARYAFANGIYDD
jgi:hypothetical protein